MYKPGDLVFAKVKGWWPWPGKIMCEVSPNMFKIYFYGTRQESLVKRDCILSSQNNIDSFSKMYGHDKDYDFALDEMKNDPDIFIVSDDDQCDHQCMTCDQRRREKEKVATVNLQSQKDDFHCSLNASQLASMKSVKVVMKSIRNVLYDRESKHETVSNQNGKVNIRKSRKKLTEKNRKNKGRLINRLYFLPSLFLKKKRPRELVNILNTLSCSMCSKICRNPIGLKIHLSEIHPEYRVEIKGAHLKKVTPVHEIDSDSSFVDIEDLLHDSSSDDIEDLLQTSDSVYSSDDIDDLLWSSDKDHSDADDFIDLT